MTVAARGLTELRRALKAAGDTEGVGLIRDANVSIAAKVLDAARPGIAAVSTTVAASASVVKSQVGAKVRLTSVRAGGVIFGAGRDLPRVGPSGRKFRGHNQFRPFRAEGYHVLPEAEQQDEQIADEYEQVVNKIMDRHGVPRA